MAKIGKLNRSQSAKVALCLLFIGVAATLFNTGHAIDSFLPKHVAAGYETVSTGRLPDNHLVSQIPGFYSFVSALFLVTGIGPLTVMHFPVQLVPYVIVFFTLAYLISRGNVVLAGLLTALQLFISSSATWRVYLWPHGVGEILFFTLLVSLVVLFRRSVARRLFFVILPCSILLVYMSYNLTAIYLLVLSGIGILFVARYPLEKYWSLEEGVCERGEIAVITASGAATATALLFSDFFYTRFVPLAQSGIKIASLYDFLLVWTSGSSPESSEIPHLLVTQPDSIRYLAITRYAIIFVSLLGLFGYLYYKIDRGRTISYADVLLLSYFIGLSLYFFTRVVFAGSVPVTIFYVLGVLSLVYLYSRVGNSTAIVLIVLLLLLLSGTIVGTQIERNSHDKINRNLEAVYHMDNEREWLNRFHSKTGAIRSDELTTNLLVYSRMLDQDIPSYAETSSAYDLVEPSQAAALTTGKSPGESQCFVLNNRPRQMSLQNWRIISSWDRHADRIHTNRYTNKVYTEGELWLFCS